MKYKLFQSIELDKYLHPGERALLNKILDVAKACNVVRDFIHAVCNEDANGLDNNLIRFLMENILSSIFSLYINK